MNDTIVKNSTNAINAHIVTAIATFDACKKHLYNCQRKLGVPNNNQDNVSDIAKDTEEIFRNLGNFSSSIAQQIKSLVFLLNNLQ